MLNHAPNYLFDALIAFCKHSYYSKPIDLSDRLTLHYTKTAKIKNLTRKFIRLLQYKIHLSDLEVGLAIQCYLIYFEVICLYLIQKSIRMIEIHSSNVYQTCHVCLSSLYLSWSRYNLIKGWKYVLFQFGSSIKNTQALPQLNMKNGKTYFFFLKLYLLLET